MGNTLDKILAVFRDSTTRRFKYKKGQPIGYKDVKDYLDRFLQYFDKANSGVTGIVLYGSIARGTGRTDSDIDLLFLTDNEGKTYREIEKAKNRIYTGEYADLLARRGLPMVHLSTRIVQNGKFEQDIERSRRNKGGFAYNCADDGVVLCDADGRTKTYLEELRTESHEKDMLIP